jgi:hypothetical protein
MFETGHIYKHYLKLRISLNNQSTKLVKKNYEK